MNYNRKSFSVSLGAAKISQDAWERTFGKKDVPADQPQHRSQAMPPTPGRVVHFRLPADHVRAGEIRPAMVIIVNPTTLNLNVFMDPANDEPLGKFEACSVEYSEEPKPRTWCWPPRV